ncbi:MAG: aminopeptidase P family protein [Flavobacteriales bacterium]|jgi:Xaa-Pro aminopeptidase|tara:strand:- start:1507 stop:2796 length:1290 start_codon:yes stop_codon:yes gene_type:complete
MRYHKLNGELFTENRRKFTDLLKPKSLAIFTSNDAYPTSADGHLPFKQHSDILYLSGADQEESILVLFPDAHKKELREVLFLKETNDLIAVWEGAKYSKEEAFEISGIQTVFWLTDFDRVFHEMVVNSERIYMNGNEHLRAHVDTELRHDRMNKWIKETYPAHEFERSQPLLHRVRGTKSEKEIEVLRMAAAVTKKGYERVLKFLKPGVWEYELEAEFMHEFLVNRSRGFAYTPIIAAGGNANVLHYIENNEQCNDGDLVLFDVGAEYGNYTCDVTRCFPVNGKFTARQKEVYNAVLRVHDGAISMLRPGIMLDVFHQQVGDLMTQELLALGLISAKDVENQDPSWPAYKKYFMHGTSHYLGLDVHDYGLWTVPVEEGMVFTVEPGIYLPEEGIGIRIEDDIVITADGHENLTRSIPKTVNEIEAFMAS